jgi:uroporphyrin-3 C-methyltransferase
VQPTAPDEVPLVSPDQQFFLRENLRMRLLSARVALLAHDPAGFKADTRSAADWLQRYFDTSDKKVGAAVTVLNQLSESDISIDLPDITATCRARCPVARERGCAERLARATRPCGTPACPPEPAPGRGAP